MSHIQKILERAERDGSIRPSLISAVPEPPRTGAVGPMPEAVLPVLTLDTPAAPPAPALRVVPGRLDPSLAATLQPGSASADQFRSLRTRIQQAAHGRSFNTLLITSPASGDGRTYTAANLALSMAQEPDRRVCLVDANLRGARLRGVFGLPDGPDLGDVLAERTRLEEALVHLEAYNLTVLPGDETTTHSELLGSPAMRRVMQALRARFDRVVIDGPAARPVADVALLTPLVDGLMLVVRAGVTTKPSIHEAIASINSDKLLGVVLNDAQ
jgi:capsular exopolysaccharide synthesis family protein